MSTRLSLHCLLSAQSVEVVMNSSSCPDLELAYRRHNYGLNEFHFERTFFIFSGNPSQLITPGGQRLRTLTNRLRTIYDLLWEIPIVEWRESFGGLPKSCAKRKLVRYSIVCKVSI